MRRRPREEDVRLDDLCREVVFARDGYACVRCGKIAEVVYDEKVPFRRTYPGFQWAHAITRGAGRRFRWYERNSMLLCARCHLWWHGRVPPFDQKPLVWWEEKFPERSHAISTMLRTRGSFDRDLTAIALKDALRRIAPDAWADWLRREEQERDRLARSLEKKSRRARKRFPLR